jgi:hypothetical protein
LLCPCASYVNFATNVYFCSGIKIIQKQPTVVNEKLPVRVEFITTVEWALYPAYGRLNTSIYLSGKFIALFLPLSNIFDENPLVMWQMYDIIYDSFKFFRQKLCECIVNK